MTSYQINGVRIKDVTECRDLGVIFDHRLSFVPHIDRMIDSAKRTLAFVMRVCRQFSNAKVIQVLYLSLILPRLEYASLIWAPSFRNHINRIEAVNRRFLKFMSWKQDGFYPERGNDTHILAARFNLLILEERRVVTSIIFIVKLLRGNIDCPQFLELLPITVPHVNSRLQVPSCVLLQDVVQVGLSPTARL